MKYKVALFKTEEGFSVSCPGLPGCWSQGESEQEAIENIQDAITQYLGAIEDLLQNADVREIEVFSLVMPRIPGVNHLDAVKALEKGVFSGNSPEQTYCNDQWHSNIDNSSA